MERYVEWKPFYSVGDTVIDEQHKRLLNMVDDLYLASQMNHDAARVQAVVERLVGYTMSHFEHEEQVMWACGYPDFEAHKSLHDEMRRRSLEFQANPATLTEKDLLQFVKSWWVRHIQNQDRKYAPYLTAVARQPVKMA
ncbi:MAG: bacteriohemerythrin [Thermoguttaceae bacterium]|jgi:hemerythrin-like metal-binding protein